MERVMIIFWRWVNFANAKGKSKMGHNFWVTRRGLAIKEDIEEGHNDFFDSYTVCSKTIKGEKIVKPIARVVRSYVDNCEDCKDYITALIDYYYKPDTKTFVFLHRRDGFTTQDVSRVLKNKNVAKCFLFGGGRDYIYYSTQNEGLLGDGDFYSSKQTPTKPKIQVANDNSKCVFQPHFDKVWNYYQHEFDIKSYELKVDLLTYFLPFCGDEKIGKEEYQRILKENQFLYIRIKSFLGKHLTKEEKLALIGLEKDQEKSFVFDDFKRNLERMANGIIKDYTKLYKLLDGLFFNGSSPLFQKSVRQNLLQIQKEFSKLILILKISETTPE